MSLSAQWEVMWKHFLELNDQYLQAKHNEMYVHAHVGAHLYIWELPETGGSYFKVVGHLESEAFECVSKDHGPCFQSRQTSD